MPSEDEKINEIIARQSSAQDIAGQLAADGANSMLESGDFSDVFSKDRVGLKRLFGLSHPIIQQFGDVDSPEEMKNLVSHVFPTPEKVRKSMATAGLAVLSTLQEVWERLEAASFGTLVEATRQVKSADLNIPKIAGAAFKPIIDPKNVEIGDQPGQYPSGGELAVEFGLRDKDNNWTEMLTSAINTPDIPESLDAIIPVNIKPIASAAEFTIRNPVTSARLAAPFLAGNLASMQLKMLGKAVKFSGLLTEPIANGVEQAVRAMHSSLPRGTQNLISDMHMNFMRLFADKFNYAPDLIKKLGDKTLLEIDRVIESSARLVHRMGKITKEQSEVIAKLLDGTVQVVDDPTMLAKMPGTRTPEELFKMLLSGTAQVTEVGIEEVPKMIVSSKELASLGINLQHVQDLRNRIDALSKFIAKEFPDKKGLVESIQKNMGKYLRRVYQTYEVERAARLAKWKARNGKIQYNVFGIRGKEFMTRASDIKKQFASQTEKLMGKYASRKAQMEINLTDLEGVGLVTEARLKTKGLGTISKIAKASPKEITEAISAINSGNAKRMIAAAKRIQEMQNFIDQKIAVLQRLKANPPRIDWSKEAMDKMGLITTFEQPFFDTVSKLTHDAFNARMFRTIATNPMFRDFVWFEKEAKMSNAIAKSYKTEDVWYHGGRKGLKELDSGWATKFKDEAQRYANQYKDGVIYEIENPDKLIKVTQKNAPSNVSGNFDNVRIINKGTTVREHISGKGIFNAEKVPVNPPEGFVKMESGNNRWGALEGAWVDPNVAKFLGQQKEMINGKLAQFIKSATSFFKTNSVILNPKSHFNQYFGNAWMASFIMDDYPMATAIENFFKASRDYGKGGSNVGLFKSLGGEKGVFARSEIMKELSDKLKIASGDGYDLWVSKLVSEYQNLKTVRKASELFSASDLLWRYSIFNHFLERGVKAEKAFKMAEEVIPNLDEVGTAVEWASKYGVAPFIRWQSKMTPKVIETMLRKPGKLVPTFLMLMGWNEGARQLHGLTRQEADKIIRQSNFGNPYALLMPFKDSNDDYVSVGLGNIIQGLDLLKGGLDRYGMGLIGNPLLDIVSIMKSPNPTDPMSGSSLNTQEKMFDAIVLKRLGAYIFPAPIREGVRQLATGKGFLGGRDAFGRTADLGIEAAKSLFSIGQLDPEIASQMEKSASRKLKTRIKFAKTESEKRQYQDKLSSLKKGNRVYL